jgi:hypothetical protein
MHYDAIIIGTGQAGKPPPVSGVGREDLDIAQACGVSATEDGGIELSFERDEERHSVRAPGSQSCDPGNSS